MHFPSLLPQALLLLSTLTLATPHDHDHASTHALSFYTADPTAGTSGKDPANAYTCYSGRATNFPPFNTWINYNAMWSRAVQYALQPIGDSAAQIRQIKAGIASVSQESKVDQRVILAIILDESTGNVRVGCTDNGVPNCGLMQSYNGTSYRPKQSAKSITQMIIDGTQGTKYGPGLVQLFNDAPGTPQKAAGNVWKAFREYNSGNVNLSNLSYGLGATPAYVSNVANFLLGWNGYGDGPANCGFTQYPPGAAESPAPRAADVTATVTSVQTITVTPTSTVTLA